MVPWIVACAPAPHPLAGATSPYLREHAGDLVRWHPWSDDAWTRARDLDRPVLLTIGYATCHWCHVMSEESWRDPEVAALVERAFVPIAVDREERPDVDDVYARVISAMGGRGGWPMTLVLAPDGQPLFAATYLPTRDGDRGAARGLLTVLSQVATRWASDREALLATAAEVSAMVRDLSAPAPPGTVPGRAVAEAAAARYRAAYDEVHGGFGGAPRFPRPPELAWLLAHAARRGDEGLREAAVGTLRAIDRGALHDPVGGGFHRYTVDEAWRVPHYEKVTSDNAQHVALHLDAWQATGDPAFLAVARETLAWLDAMWIDGGGLATALDADSPGRDGRLTEGAYYVWTAEEVGDPALARALGLGPEPAAPWLAGPVDPVALAALRAKRAERPAPLRDDKTVAAVQGFAIAAYARASVALGEPDLARRAGELADLVLGRMAGPDGRLRRTLAPDAPPGVLDDQVRVAAGLLDLFEANADPRRLVAAVALMEGVEARFSDADGGWFQVADDAEPLLVRARSERDGSEPCGASVAVETLLRLAALTGDDRWLDRADRALAAYAVPLERRPTSLVAMLEALERRRDPPPEVVVTWPDGADPEPLLGVVRRTYVPGRTLVAAPAGGLRALAARVPLVREKEPLGGPTAWVCEQGVCLLPSTDAAALEEALRRVTEPEEGR